MAQWFRVLSLNALACFPEFEPSPPFFCLKFYFPPITYSFLTLSNSLSSFLTSHKTQGLEIRTFSLLTAVRHSLAGSGPLSFRRGDDTQSHSRPFSSVVTELLSSQFAQSQLQLLSSHKPLEFIQVNFLCLNFHLPMLE